ncbi:hypothetical protein GCM10028784_24700 [Myceligenerans cantabricum]
MRGARLRAGAVLLAVLLLGAGTVPAWAWWTDQGTVRSGTLGTGAVPATTATCGALGVLTVTFQWAAVDGATSYVVHHGPGGSSTEVVTGTQFTTTSPISGGTFWVVAQREFPGTTWASAESNQLTYTVAVVALCV